MTTDKRVQALNTFGRALGAGGPVRAVPEADLFPLLAAKDYEDLKADILTRRRVEEPIRINHKGEVVDGRNRVRVLCDLLKSGHYHVQVDEVFRIFRESDGYQLTAPVFVVDDEAISATVIALNIHRRHLTPEQRAELVAKLVKPMTKSEAGALGGKASKGQVSPASESERKGLSVKQAASVAKVSESTMKRALAKSRPTRPAPPSAQQRRIPQARDLPRRIHVERVEHREVDRAITVERGESAKPSKIGRLAYWRRKLYEQARTMRNEGFGAAQVAEIFQMALDEAQGTEG